MWKIKLLCLWQSILITLGLSLLIWLQHIENCKLSLSLGNVFFWHFKKKKKKHNNNKTKQKNSRPMFFILLAICEKNPTWNSETFSTFPLRPYEANIITTGYVYHVTLCRFNISICHRWQLSICPSSVLQTEEILIHVDSPSKIPTLY